MDKPQFYFMFSSGEYSDYGVGGIYVCDHQVTKEEWHAHYIAFQDAEREYRATLSDPYGDDWDGLQQWLKTNDPETTFQKLHNMKKLEVAEFWRDA